MNISKSTYLFSFLSFLLSGVCFGKSSQVETVNHLLTGLDQAVEQGTVTYRINSYTPTPEGNPGGAITDANIKLQHRTYIEVWEYTKDGKYRQTVKEIRNGNLLGSTEIFDKTHYVSIVNQDMSVLSNQPEVFKTNMAYIGLVPRACFPMGRGLSTLLNLKKLSTKNGLSVEGRTKSNIVIHAQLDIKHDHISRSIERKSPDGRTLCKWIFGSVKKSIDDVWIPERASYICYQENGERNTQFDYQLIYANFRKPNAAVFKIPLSGKRIADNRLGTSTLYNQLPPGVSNLEELLKITKSEAQAKIQMESASRKSIKHQKEIQIVISFFFFSALATCGILIYLSIRKG